MSRNLDEIRQWKEARITQMIMRKLEDHFDPHRFLLGAENGKSIDLYKGQRQVIDMLRNAEDLFDGYEENENG